MDEWTDRRLLRHEEMALEYLWTGVPCRSPAGAPARDRFQTVLPRIDAPEVPVGRVAVPKICQKTPFATRGWH